MRFSLAGGVAFQLGPVYLPQMQAAGLFGRPPVEWWVEGC